ncbi:MAG: hypothetical protein GY788_21180 [bacterium]|nr:hypothetical protein [bacterium]
MNPLLLARHLRRAGYPVPARNLARLLLEGRPNWPVIRPAARGHMVSIEPDARGGLVAYAVHPPVHGPTIIATEYGVERHRDTIPDPPADPPVRCTVMLTRGLVQALDARAGVRGRSAVVRDAVAEHLAKEAT